MRDVKVWYGPVENTETRQVETRRQSKDIADAKRNLLNLEGAYVSSLIPNALTIDWSYDSEAICPSALPMKKRHSEFRSHLYTY